jgi:4-hydroxy-tetrahydrodipicolinate synthase
MSASASARPFGLGCAIATPVTADGAIDLQRFTAHASACLAGGCDSLTLFGTTGEGPSFGIAPRQQAFAAFADAGIAATGRLLSGVMTLTEEDALAQAEVALAAGCTGLLIAPPCYFRQVSDDSLFAWFSRVIAPLDGRTRVFLYHIPSMTGVGISPALVGRLRAAFPEAIAGVKDSSGNWDNTAALLAQHRDLQILVGDERLLARAVRFGGSGTICGMANIVPEILQGPARRGEDDPRIAPLIELAFKNPIIPSLKAMIAHCKQDLAWSLTREPLPALSEQLVREIGISMDALMARPLAA